MDRAASLHPPLSSWCAPQVGRVGERLSNCTSPAIVWRTQQRNVEETETTFETKRAGGRRSNERARPDSQGPGFAQAQGNASVAPWSLKRRESQGATRRRANGEAHVFGLLAGRHDQFIFLQHDPVVAWMFERNDGDGGGTAGESSGR